jgi:hypothetical protein
MLARTLHAKEQRVQTFQRISLTSNCCNPNQNQTTVNSIASIIHIGKTLTSTTVGKMFYHRQAQFCNEHNINIPFMRAGRYLTNTCTLQLKLRDSVELACVLEETED